MFSEARYDKNNILWSVGFVIGQSNTDCSCNDFKKAENPLQNHYHANNMKICFKKIKYVIFSYFTIN